MEEAGQPADPGDEAPAEPSTGDLAESEASTVDELTQWWRVRAQRMGRAQYLAAHRNQRLNNWLGIPVVVLTAVVGTSIFATLTSTPGVGWAIAAGVVSMVAAVLAALQTFFRFEEAAQKHKAAGADYAAIKRSLDHLKARIRIGNESVEVLLGEIAENLRFLNQIEHQSPDVPDRDYDQAKREQLNDKEGT